MDGHLHLAARFAAARRPQLMITHGLSGSGKTVVSGELVEALGAVRLRSDVERKRLAGLEAKQRSGSGLNAGLYTAEMTGLTYARLLDSARAAIQAGYSMIVDAAFLQRERRIPFQELARELSVPFAIIDVRCAPEELRRRVVARGAAGRDASEAGLDVLEQQMRNADPLSDDEQAASVVVDTNKEQALEPVVAALRRAT
jgi:predicted kinase